MNGEATRLSILEAIKKGSHLGVTPSEIEAACFVSASGVRHQLEILLREGKITKVSRGLYLAN